MEEVEKDLHQSSENEAATVNQSVGCTACVVFSIYKMFGPDGVKELQT